MKFALIGAVMAFALGACGSPPTGTVGAPSVGPAPAAASPSASSLSPSLNLDRAETIYLDATAAHLCTVQSRVYADPKELADAYATQPPYPQLTSAQVSAFNQRVTSDGAFATKLTERVKSTCGATR